MYTSFSLYTQSICRSLRTWTSSHLPSRRSLKSLGSHSGHLLATISLGFTLGLATIYSPQVLAQEATPPAEQAQPQTESQPAPSPSSQPADNSAAKEEAAATPAESTSPAPAENAQGDAVPDVLAPLQNQVSPKQENQEIEVKRDSRLNLMHSMNPADFQRKEGIWISDTGNGRIIYMKDLDGEDFFPLGMAGHGMGRFLYPEQIWVDVKGRIYVADRGNNRIVRMDDMRGLNWTEKEGFKAPKGVAFHSKRLYVSDTGNNRILVYNDFDAEEPMVTLEDEKINSPGYMWLDMEGNLYVCCGEYPPGGRVVVIPFDLTVPAGDWKVYDGHRLSGHDFQPGQVLIDDSGDPYLIDTASNRLVKMDNLKGRGIWEFGSYGNSLGQFREPLSMSSDQQGRIYIADTGNDRIVRLDNVKGKGWRAYDTTEPNFSLRSPHCIYVWSPRPEDEDLDEEDDKDKKDKDESEDQDQDE